MVPSDKPDIQLVFNLLQVTFIRNAYKSLSDFVQKRKKE